MGFQLHKSLHSASGPKQGQESKNSGSPQQVKPKKQNNTLRWFITGAMTISALSFFPSLASLLLLFIAVCAVPIPLISDWLSGRLHLAGKGKAAAMVAALFAAALIAPTDALLPVPPEGETASVIIETAKTGDSTKANKPADESAQPQDSESNPSVRAVQGDSGTESEAAVTSSTAGTDPSSAPVPASSEAESEPSAQENEQKTGYVGSIGSDKYHDPSCRWAKKILPENEIWFSSKEEAQAAGYSPCGTCQ